MILQLVVLQLILLAWVPSNTLAVAPSLAKPGCQEYCGEVTIPFPFGTGNSSCYHDEWFEIDCQKNTADVSRSKPFLKKLNLEVLDISLPSRFLAEGRITIRSPIIYSDCNGSRASTGPALDLRGSTFVFSQFMNRFAAVGRNNSAVMANIEPDLAGCTPSTSNCSDKIMDCCETTIPSDLKVFNVRFQSISAADGGGQECKYAFIDNT